MRVVLHHIVLCCLCVYVMSTARNCTPVDLRVQRFVGRANTPNTITMYVYIYIYIYIYICIYNHGRDAILPHIHTQAVFNALYVI